MTFNPIQTESVKVTRADGVAARRFVTWGGAYPAQGGFAVGVTRTAADKDDVVAADVLGRLEVEAGAVIAADAQIQSAADGRAETQAGAGIGAGRALTAAAAAGDIIQVLRGV